MFEKKNTVYTSEAEYLHEQQHPQKRRRLTKSEVRWLVITAVLILLALLFLSDSGILRMKRFSISEQAVPASIP